MKKRKQKDLSMSKNPRFTKSEEVANSISHGLGTILAIIALILLIEKAHTMWTISHLLWAIVFWIGLILLYFSSTLNHALPIGTRGKDFFHNFDQISIYFFIAGTFTPLCLLALQGRQARGLLALERWIALIGICSRIFKPMDFENGVNTINIISYSLMGGIMFCFIPNLSHIIELQWVFLLCCGCCIYALGIIAFKLERLKYAHFIRHLVVLIGSFFHFFAIHQYILPIELL